MYLELSLKKPFWQAYVYAATFCVYLVSILGERNTFDFCTSKSDCRETLLCMYSTTNGLRDLCPSSPSSATLCRCEPTYGSAVVCDSDNSTCARGEGCGIFSKKKMCISCTVLLNGTEKYVPINDKVCTNSPSPVPSATRSPGPLRLAFDFCSPEEGCMEDYSCLTPENENCLASHGQCNCFRKNLTYTTCKDVSECERTGETCAINTKYGFSACVSCNHVSQTTFFIPVHENDTSCLNNTHLPFPDYPMSSDGNTGDFCKNPIQCQGSRACIEYPNNSTCKNNYFSACQCWDIYNGPSNCSMESPICPPGEICALSKTTGLTHCYSANYMARDAQGEDQLFILYGQYPNHKMGLAGDLCKTNWDCEETLQCTHLSETGGGCAGREACKCQPLVYKPCASDIQCHENEVCVRYPGAKSNAFCYSSDAADNQTTLIGVKSPVPSPFTSGSGWQGDRCITSDDCQNSDGRNRTCRHMTEEYGRCQGGRPGCVCKFDLKCSLSYDCGEGEVCVAFVDTIQTHGKCISKNQLFVDDDHEFYRIYNFGNLTAIPTTDPPENGSQSTPPNSSEENAEVNSATPEQSQETSEVCVDDEALSTLSQQEKVYKKARLASVLCDENGSCATAGHIIIWNGVMMTMKSYCRQFGVCHRQVKWVNSPRMKKGLRLVSRTHRLQYTAFAARYETTMESLILFLLLQLGF